MRETLPKPLPLMFGDEGGYVNRKTDAGGLYLIIELPRLTHLLFLAWVTGALLLYFSYSFRNSVLAKPQPAGSPP